MRDDLLPTSHLCDRCVTLYVDGERHTCPTPCESCGLLVALDGFGELAPRWVERYVHDGAWCYMSRVAHTSVRCAVWRNGVDLCQGLGSRPSRTCSALGCIGVNTCEGVV